MVLFPGKTFCAFFWPKFTEYMLRDYNAPTPRPADTSAAMLIANGLLMLAQYDPEAGAKDRWTNAAVQVLQSNIPFAWKTSWQSILSNGTSNKPSNNYNTGLVYGKLDLWLDFCKLANVRCPIY